MNSEKQIKWAEEIKSKMDFASLRKMAANSPVAMKAIEYVENNQEASFWITYRNSTAMDLMNKLMTTGLQIKGDGFEHRAVMSKDGTITITWKEIVRDGKGGHEETRTQTI